jgi:hypothetical protein
MISITKDKINMREAALKNGLLKPKNKKERDLVKRDKKKGK